MRLYLALAGFVLVCTSPPSAAELPIHKAGLTLFDDIITRMEMARGFEREIPFSFNVHEESNARVYVGVYEFPRTRPAQHYVFSAVVAPAGVLLDVREYERRRAEFERQPNLSEDALRAEFPAIGKRAQRDVLTFGPGGAAYGLTFATSDGTFDVRIVVSNLLPATVEPPNFRVYETAHRISYLYDTRRIGKH
jgi:hypothetical protein